MYEFKLAQKSGSVPYAIHFNWLIGYDAKLTHTHKHRHTHRQCTRTNTSRFTIRLIDGEEESGGGWWNFTLPRAAAAGLVGFCGAVGVGHGEPGEEWSMLMSSGHHHTTLNRAATTNPAKRNCARRCRPVGARPVLTRMCSRAAPSELIQHIVRICQRLGAII